MIDIETVHKLLTHGLVKHDIWKTVQVRTVYTEKGSYIIFREQNGKQHKLNLTESGVRQEFSGDVVPDEILLADPDFVDNVFKVFDLI